MTGAMTRATAPVAAEIMAGRPPRKAIDTAMVNEANSPTRGSTPAMMENEMASGMRARATTRPPRTSMRKRLGERSAARTEVTSRSWGNSVGWSDAGLGGAADKGFSRNVRVDGGHDGHPRHLDVQGEGRG